MQWMIWSLLGLVSFGVLGFLMKFLPSSMGGISFYLFMSSVILFAISLGFGEKLELDKKKLPIIFVCSFLLALGNLSQIRAVQKAAEEKVNPGIAVMIICMCFIIILFLSLIFLKISVTWKQAIAIGLGIAAIILSSI